MNVTKENLSGIMEQIDTDRDLVSSARARAQHKQRKNFRYKPVAAVLCAVVLLCGVTVSAAAIGGWTERIFGESAERLDEDYKLEIGNVTVENADGVPCEFTIKDVISDGKSLFMNLLVKGLDVDYNALGGNVFGWVDLIDRYDWTSSEWKLLGTGDGTADTSANINFTSGIKKGDIIELEFRLASWVPGSGGKDTKLAVISFEIMNDVNHMEKVVEVGQSAVLSAWKWTGVGKDVRQETADFYVEELRITPLQCIIRGRPDGGESGVNITPSGVDNYNIVYKNGGTKRIFMTISRDETDDYYQYLYTDIYIHFDEVENLDEIAAIRVGDITIPVSREDAEGDIYTEVHK